MGRELDDKDRDILKKLVPEFQDLLLQGIDLEYANILPPVANHHAKDEKDFEERLNRLSASEIKYLSDRVQDGSESLGCIYPEFAEVFFTIAGKKLSSEIADQLREIYDEGVNCSG